ncbi:MAG: patatin-like phospholipase family protein, partial [Rhodoferax sp.]
MSLDTVLHAGFTQTPHPSSALVLMGGGARTAYQVGVLQALAAMLRKRPNASPDFPFQILIGTSAGAVNTTYLASCATQGLLAFDQLARFWGRLRSKAVYASNIGSRIPWTGTAGRFLAAMSLSRQALAQGAILDNMPLVDTLHHAISLSAIEDSLCSGTIEALAVTASS